MELKTDDCQKPDNTFSQHDYFCSQLKTEMISSLSLRIFLIQKGVAFVALFLWQG
jgi:hypothetical protein